MSEELRKRIGDAYLNPTFVDGQVLLHTQLNEIVSVVKTGINENYYDIQRLIKGEYSVGNSEKINGALLSRYLDTTLQEDDNLVPSSQQVKAYIDTEIEKVQKSFDVGDLILEVNDLKTKVSTNENSISAVEISIEELKQSDNLISGNLKRLEDELVSTNNSISALSGSLSATQEQVVANEESISNLQTSVITNSENITGLSSRVTNLENNKSEVATKVESLETSNIELTNKITSLEEDNIEFNNKVTSLELSISDIQSSIGEVNTLLATLTTVSGVE